MVKHSKIGYNVYVFTKKHAKLSNMFLEIKPYHVDITMKQNVISIKN